MKTAGIHLPKSRIGEQRQPGQRMPRQLLPPIGSSDFLGELSRAECPAGILRRQSFDDMLVNVTVTLALKILQRDSVHIGHEIEPSDLGKWHGS